jgi:alpha-tubulin suppressor-like RCC1 family protein
MNNTPSKPINAQHRLPARRAGLIRSLAAAFAVVLASPCLAGPAPTIQDQSPSQTVAAGGTATFSVVADGATPLSYFWSLNGTPIPNATNATYSLFNAQLSATGSFFSCLVTNAAGSASSSNMYLKVIEVVANGLCSGAIVITTASYTNLQSTLQADAPGNPAPDCVSGFGHGVWYEFTAPVAGLLSVDTFGSDFDTGLGLYTGSCDSLTQVACNDDADGQPTSQIMFPTAAGTTYYILAGGYASDAGNLVLHLNHLTPPAFDVEPTNLFVDVGSNAVFTDTMSGSQPMSFQWYFNNTPLADGGRVSGSATAALTINNVTTNDGGNYQVVASNIVGVTTSSVAVLTPVILPPVFITPPANLAVGQGSNANFFAVVGGTPPFAYQWSVNGDPLADDGVHYFGSATSSLTISNITTADTGLYVLTVTNSSGSASFGASLTVLTPPGFNSQLLGRSVPPGLPTTFNLSVTGNPAPACQWQLNGSNLPGATNLTYSITGVGTLDLGSYQAVLSNLMGVTTSPAAQLTFGPVAAWGNNGDNECLPPPGLSNVVAVAGDQSAGFAVRADGTIATWGSGAGTNVPAAATNVVAISSSEGIADYALRANGTVIGWNAAGVPALSNVVSIAAGYLFTVALRAEGVPVAWGTSPASTVPAGLSHITAVAAGYTQALALRGDGTVAAWGSGPGTNVPLGLANVTAIAAGYGQSLALESNGTVIGWGSGNGTNIPAGLTNVVAIYAGGYPQGQSLSLAVRADGTVVAWGDDGFGETNVPAALNQLMTVSAAAAPYRSYALINDGRPQILLPPVGLTTYVGRTVTLQARAAGTAPLRYQWLLNGTDIPQATNSSLVIPGIQLANAGNYQLLVTNSLGSALSLAAPVTVLNNNQLTFLAQASAESTNVYQGGKLTLLSGAILGNGPLTYQWQRLVPSGTPSYPWNFIPIAGATNDTLTFDPALAAQSGGYALAVSNQFGGVLSSAVSVRVMFEKAWGFDAIDAPFVLTNATAVALGNYGEGDNMGSYLALSSAGRISSWSGGYTEYGETNFASLSNSIVTAIAAGYADTLALKSDGTVLALGGSSQLLPGYIVTNVPAGAVGVTAIACGDYHDLALRYDGTVVGWGQSTYGQTTNGAATNVVAIAAGGQDSIALRADGSVTTWGYVGASRGTPVPFNATNIVAVAAGATHFLALYANGTVLGWGNNGYGQTTIPTNWNNIVAISAGANHSTALRNDGTVMTLGTFNFATNMPGDLTNVVAIASSGDRDLALFGTRAPVFTVQPWNRTVANTVTSVWFAAKCAGVQPVRYQWQFNGTNVPGATNDTLTVNAALAAGYFPRPTYAPLQPGVYQLMASNAYGVAVSHYVQLNVVIPLGVALNATNLNWTTSGDNQWYGETNVTHDGVSAAQSGDIGPFQDTILQTTVVSNTPGTCSFWWKVSSEPDFDFLEFRINGLVQASISGEVGWQQLSFPLAAGTNVLLWHYYKDSIYSSGLDAGWVDQFVFAPNPVIEQQPANVTAYAGTTASFSVAASSGSQQQYLIGYQWQKNGVNLINGGHVGGANTYHLVLNNVQDADAANYTVVVTNAAGGITVSQPATLTVLDVPPIITVQPSSATNNAGSAATFNAAAVGSLPMQYEWYKNGTDTAVGGSFTGGSVQLALSNVQDADAAAYSVIFTNLYGSTTSSPAMLAVVDTKPVILVQPVSTTVLRGQGASFTLTVQGSTPISYQWQHDGTNLPNATNVMLTLNSVAMPNDGAYHVSLTNRYGASQSSDASLNVVRSLVVAWGDDTDGQSSVPPLSKDVVAIAAGEYHSLALQADGTVVAWGDGSYGDTNLPAGLANVVALGGGGYDSLAAQASGTVFAWGDNSSGQTNIPVQAANTVALAAGWTHDLALQANGTVVAWGSDESGEADVPAGVTNAVAVAAGMNFSLALQANGTVAAWGYDYNGQAAAPVNLTNVTAIAAGGEHSLALQASGTVTAWGNDEFGQTDAPADLTNALAIAGGEFHSLALRADGTVAAWGYNYNGQTAVPAGLSNAVAVAAGNNHSLAIQSDGSPFITTQPRSQWAVSNATVQFTVAALGVPNLGYRWQKNGVNLADGGNVSGAATPTLTLSNVQGSDLATYTVVVTNAIDSTTSLPAALIVAGPPFILSQPISQTAIYGATVQFSVVAAGNPPPAYSWWWNGTNPVGGNSPTLTLTGVARAQDGVYTVLVTNTAGGLLSSNAVLEVLVPQVIGAPALLPNGALQFTSGDFGGGALSAADLASFTVQTSTNLVNWVTAPNTLSITNGMLLWQDNAPGTYPLRFYRIVEH